MGQNTGCSFALKLPVASSFGSDKGKQTETEERLSTLKVTCAAAVMHCRGHRGQDRFTVLCCVKELEREKRVINRQRERGEVSRDSVRLMSHRLDRSFFVNTSPFCQQCRFISAWFTWMLGTIILGGKNPQVSVSWRPSFVPVSTSTLWAIFVIIFPGEQFTWESSYKDKPFEILWEVQLVHQFHILFVFFIFVGFWLFLW